MKAQKSPSIAISILFSVFLLTFVGGCVTSKQKALDAGMKPLDEQGLQSLFAAPFNASYSSSQKNLTSVVQYFPDGKQTISNSKISDEGTWRIKNGEQCSKWKVIRKGAEACTTWIKIADDKYEVYGSNGAKSGVLTITK